MRTLTLQEVAALARVPLKLVACWVVEDALGNVSRHTAHDRDIVVTKTGLAGTYVSTKPIDATTVRAASDLSVQNLEVLAPMADGLAQDAIRAGMFDGVEYTIFLTDWSAPTNVGIIVHRGHVANVRMVDEMVASFELRGLKNKLAQNIVRSVQRTCDADLGDTRCGKDLSAFEVEGCVVESVDSETRRIFTASDVEPGSEPEGWYDNGKITWLTGDNAGFSIEVKRHQSGGVLELLSMLPYPIEVGDTFDIVPGCDKLITTCDAKYDNVVNFRGFPYAVEQSDLVAEVPQ